MKDFAGNNDNQNNDELQRVPEFVRASAYLDKRQQQTLQSEQAIIGLQRTIRNVAIDIAHLLIATPSAGNRAMLERSFAELNGLANAVAQTAAAAPSGSDSGASRGAGVDLNGTRAAIETHANSASENSPMAARDKTRGHAATAGSLPSLDTPQEPSADPNARGGADLPGDPKAPAGGADQSASDSAKRPTADAPSSKLDQVKLALAESRANEPAESASSDPALLPNKPGSRSNAAALKLDHAEALARSDTPDRQRAQGAEPTAHAASTPAKAEPTVAAAVRKPPSPGGM